MPGFRLLSLVRPFLAVLPDVQTSDRRVPFREKVRGPEQATHIDLPLVDANSCQQPSGKRSQNIGEAVDCDADHELSFTLAGQPY